MNTPEKCPFCASLKVTSATIVSSGDNVWLQLDEAKVPFWKPVWHLGISFSHQCQFCLQCGMLWAQASLTEAYDFVERYGSLDLKDQIRNSDFLERHSPNALDASAQAESEAPPPRRPPAK